MAFHVDSKAPSAMPAMMLAAKKYVGSSEKVQRNIATGTPTNPRMRIHFRPMRSERMPNGMAQSIMARPEAPMIRPTSLELTPLSGR